MTLLTRAACPTTAQTTVSPSDPNIQYTGRIDDSDPNAPLLGWSGTSIIANFQGTSIAARFDDNGDNHLYYRLNGGDPQSLDLGPSAATYTLAEGLSDGVHRLEIGKKTEGTHGEVRFLGLAIDEGRSLSPPPERPGLKLIFFGDSNQAGYSAECICDGGSPAHEDSYYTYPAITSRMLNAEYHNISASGISVSSSPRDWKITDIWNRTYYGSGSGPVWDPSGDSPDAVVINLGANDVYAGQSKLQIKDGWKSFITNQVRSAYPDAHVVLANSYGWAFDEPADYVGEAVEELQDAGDPNVSFVRFPWLWSQAHAVTFEQAGFANILAEHLADVLELEQPAPNELSSFAPPGQLPNGGFERSNLEGVPDGWRYFGRNATYVEAASDARSGTDYVQVSGSRSGFWHATDATPGHRYELSGWLRGGGSSENGVLRIEFKNQAQEVIATIQESFGIGNNWESVSLEATAPTGSWQIAVSTLAAAGSTVAFDDLLMRDLDGPEIVPTDFDEDGDVDGVDLGIWRDATGKDSRADADNDADSDLSDLLSFQRAASASGVQAVASVPEPAIEGAMTTTIAWWLRSFREHWAKQRRRE